jgi:hypothetical protein
MPDTAETMLRPDTKGRINLGKRTAGISGYKLTDMGGGNLMLTAMTEIPARELWLYKNPEALAMVEEGLRQSARGETVRMGSFAQYANEDD